MERRWVPELMDEAGVDRDEQRRALAFIRAVNLRLGGWRVLRRHLEELSASWRPGQAVTMCDLGTGSADLPVLAVRWARASGFEMRVVAVDNHPVTLELAEEHVIAHPEEAGSIELVEHDALQAVDRFGVASFDAVHAGMFLHHLRNDIAVMTQLRVMERLSRGGVLWNDLLRSRLALLGSKLISARACETVRHDAVASVRHAFTLGEVRDYAHRLGWSWARARRWTLYQRFTLGGKVPR